MAIASTAFESSAAPPNSAQWTERVLRGLIIAFLRSTELRKLSAN